MTLSTVSVFDILADEENNSRVSSRQALALAHTRIENSLGRYLRGATTMTEFDARMAAVQDDFASYVAEACAETGGGNPSHIARSLADHYATQRKWQPRVAEVIDADDPDEESDLTEDEESALKPWLKKKKAAETGVTKEMDDDEEDEDPDKNRDDDSDDGKPPWLNKKAAPDLFGEGGNLNPDPGFGGGMHSQPDTGFGAQRGMIKPCPFCGTRKSEGMPCPTCGENDFPESAQGYEHPDPMMDNEPGSLTFPEHWGRMGANDPSDQRDDGNKMVTCPECGGDGKQAGVNKCGKCKGAGKVPNFGNSMLDALSHKIAMPFGYEEDPQMAPNAEDVGDVDPGFGGPEVCPECGQVHPPHVNQGGYEQPSGRGHMEPSTWSTQMPPGYSSVRDPRTAEDQGNTGLGAPEPKMDKKKWTPQNLDQMPGENSGGRWPNKRKDIIDVIKAENREDEGHIPEEINSVTEVETLPTATGDSGFAEPKSDLGKAPTSWQGGNDQASPVTHETL